MSDIFDEVSAELRRDNMQAAWNKYGRYVIALAVAIVVLVAVIIGASSYIEARNEAASARYDAMLDTLVEDESAANTEKLLAFAAAEDNGYGALALFSAAVQQARDNDYAAALQNFDALADNGSLPDSLRNLAALQGAIALLHSDGALSNIEERLEDLLDDESGLQPMARETMALAYMAHDKPLLARDLFKKQLADPSVTSLTRERATIMLQIVGGALLNTASDAAAAEADK